MLRCNHCEEPISAARITSFLSIKGNLPEECQDCSTVVKPFGLMNAPHKTGSEIMVLDRNNKEHIRQAKRFIRRAR